MNRQDLVISLPHWTTEVPSEMRPRMKLTDEQIFDEHDPFTAELYDVDGVRKVRARVSRLIADPNRAPDEFYWEGPDRATGVVKLQLEDGTKIYDVDPSEEELQQIVQAYHRAFHDELAMVLKDAKYLIDCHSMWSHPPYTGKATAKRPQVILSNMRHLTTTKDEIERIADFFNAKGYDTAINDPFQGRFTIGYHCRYDSKPGFQIELRRDFYMDEERRVRKPEAIARFRQDFTELVDWL